MQAKNATGFLLVVVLILSAAGCKKEKPTPVGNWQLTGYNQIAHSLNGLGTIDTFEYVMDNNVITYKKNGLAQNSYGLLLQLNLVNDASAILNQVLTPVGSPAQVTEFNGNWHYAVDIPKGKMDFGGLTDSHLYNTTQLYHVSSILLGVSYFNVEQLSDNVMVLTYHYRIYDPNTLELEENGCKLTFSKF